MKNVYKITCLYNGELCIGSDSGASARPPLSEHGFVHGQGAGHDEAFHEKGAYGCTALAHHTRHLRPVCSTGVVAQRVRRKSWDMQGIAWLVVVFKLQNFSN